MKFKYEIVTVDHTHGQADDPQTVEDRLNELGALGYRVVAAVSPEQRYTTESWIILERTIGKVAPIDVEGSPV